MRHLPNKTQYTLVDATGFTMSDAMCEWTSVVTRVSSAVISAAAQAVNTPQAPDLLLTLSPMISFHTYSAFLTHLPFVLFLKKKAFNVGFKHRSA